MLSVKRIQECLYCVKRKNGKEDSTIILSMAFTIKAVAIMTLKEGKYSRATVSSCWLYYIMGQWWSLCFEVSTTKAFHIYIYIYTHTHTHTHINTHTFTILYYFYLKIKTTRLKETSITPTFPD